MNPTLKRIRSFARRYAPLLIIALLIVVFTAGYVLGFRVGPGLTVVRAGTLVLTNIPTDAVVYADEAKRAVGHGTDVRIALVPGNHSIIVDSVGNHPWSDLVPVTAGTDLRISPVFVPVTADRSSLEEPARTEATKALAAALLPDATHPIVMENGCANVFVSNNRVVATVATSTGCTPPPYLCVGGTCATTVIFAPIAKLHSVIAYPGRQDVLIIGYGTTLAVFELNPLKPQFFAPLFNGGLAPVAIPWDAGTIVVRDDNRTFTLPI
ncbi:MAG: hypothetical protein AB203_00725 [Parcubacteria bacterium C7867-008]|nr:MAG: hypothetical protein AB203_00725 [Parcubacteria bacterium C7867-008]